MQSWNRFYLTTITFNLFHCFYFLFVRFFASVRQRKCWSDFSNVAHCYYTFVYAQHSSRKHKIQFETIHLEGMIKFYSHSFLSNECTCPKGTLFFPNRNSPELRHYLFGAFFAGVLNIYTWFWLYTTNLWAWIMLGRWVHFRDRQIYLRLSMCSVLIVRKKSVSKMMITDFF